MIEDDLPILGEPLPVELANTHYGQGDDFIDFLGSPELIALWVGAVDADLGGLPDVLDHDALRALRDALHRVLCAVVAGREPAGADIGALNDAAVRGGASQVLVWGEPPRCVWQHRGSPAEVFLGRLATQSIALLGSPACAALRVCEGLDCTMFYVQDHHRRRFCHPSCGQRARQAAYYRRKRGKT